MKIVLQRILSLFLVTLILAFTVGISMYEHYCGCSDKRIASVFVEVACADDHGQSCCSARPAEDLSCCSEGQQNYCEHQTNCDAGNCCKTEQEIIQIESEYQVSQEESIDYNLLPIKLIAVITANPEPQINVFTEGYYTETAPPVYGRQFLTAVHQLKIDVPVC